MNSVEPFKDIAARYAGIIGRRDGISVFFKAGREAYTDGKTIVVPDVPYGTILTDQQQLVFGGYLDHESAHLRETAFEVFKGLDGFLHSLTNLIEDIRVENIQIDRYPGMKTYLNALCNEVDSWAWEEHDVNHVWAAMYREVFEKYRDVHTGIKWDLTTMGLGKVSDLLQQVPRLSSTYGAMSLAKKIMEALKEAQKKTPPPPPQGMGQDGEPKEGDQEAQGQGGADQEQGPGDSQISAQTKKEIKELLASTPKDKKLEALLNAMKGDPQDQAPSVSNHRGTKILPPLDKTRDQIMVPLPKRRYKTNPDVSMSHNTARLQRELMRVLQSRELRAWRRDQEEGDLDNTALYSVPTGNKRIYQTKRERRSINTALELLIDASSSMNTKEIQKASAILVDGLKTIPRLKFELVTFCIPSEGDYQSRGQKTGIGRTDPMEMTVIKAFGESAGAATQNLGAIRTKGSTPLGEAYAIGMENLLRRREPRRILWIVTDGCPCFSMSDADHSDYVLMDRTHRQCKRLGIDTVGLGVRTDVMKKYVDTAVNVRNDQEMLDKILELARQMV